MSPIEYAGSGLSWLTGRISRARAVLTTIGAAIAIGGGIVGAWASLGLPVPATQTYVEQRLQPIESLVGRLSVETAQWHLSQLDDQIFNLRLKSRDIQEPTAAAVVQAQISKLQDDRLATQGRLTELQRPKIGNP